MLYYLPLALLFGPSIIAALPINDPIASSISWFPCPEGPDGPIQCGSLEVPLDYTDSSSSKLTLQLVRAKAITEPAKGSILFNPGGPGSGGRQDLANSYKDYLNITGGQYNLISFDPRGTGNTIPFSCYATSEARTKAVGSFPHSTNESRDATDEIWAFKKTYSKACQEANSANGNFIGTAFVARDMMQIVDALNEDKLLRYWGFSYGTTLGATVAAMYPDRMDKIVLDGVQNVFEYYHAPAPVQQGAGADATLEKFCQSCVEAGSKRCVLAEAGVSASQLYDAIWILLDYVKANNIPYGPGPDDYYKYGELKQAIHKNLYNFPGYFEDLAMLLSQAFKQVDEAINGVNTKRTRSTSGKVPIFPKTSTYDPLSGIQCSDNTVRTNDLASLVPSIEKQEDVSRLVGDLLAQQVTLTCPQWAFQAKGAYDGNFQAKTKSPMLFIGSPYDPITPLVSAFDVSAGFEGSVVLEHNGVGHTTFAQSSDCVNDYIRSYFTDGKLPAKGTKCQATAPLWPSPES